MESRKDDYKDDKLRWDLLPLAEIEDIVRVYHAGAEKYGPNKWQNLPNGFERYRAAANRHIMQYMKGEKIDTETGCYHLAQAVWNMIAMLYYDKHGKGKDFSKIKTEQFIERASLVHGNKYRYDNSVYVSSKSKIEIECPIHGPFWQTPHNHLSGAGCPKCRYDNNKRALFGIGINDMPLSKRSRAYNVWRHLLKRCRGNNRSKAYKDCSICDEWKLFSNFKKFYDDNCTDDTFHLDKDLLVQGNKKYSPETCAFLPREINETIKTEWTENRSLPVGVTMTKFGKYRAKCRTDHDVVNDHIGCYSTEEEAFSVYLNHKKERFKNMADKYKALGQIDDRTYKAILDYKIYPFPYGDKRNDYYDKNFKLRVGDD